VKILVTGASGFIGSAFVIRLLGTTQYSVVALTRWTEKKNYARLHGPVRGTIVKKAEDDGRLRVVCGDLLQDVSGLCEGCDAVINFAAKTFVDHCYSADTEVLTKRGWLFWPEVKDDDIFATRHPKSGLFQWQNAFEVVRAPYEGAMLRFSGKSLDLLVTPNHRMIGRKVVDTRNWVLGKEEILKARDVASMPVCHRGVPFRLPSVVSGWNGKKVDSTIYLSLLDDFGVKYSRKSYSLQLRDWVAFLGLFIAEGFVAGTLRKEKTNRQKKPLFVRAIAASSSEEKTIPVAKGHYSVSICQSFSSRHITKIRALLKRLPWRFSFQKNSFTTSNKVLYSNLSVLGNSYTKRVPQWLKELPTEYLEEFVKWACMGDGWVGSRKSGRSYSYSTVCRGLSEDMLEIFQKLGMAASLGVSSVPLKVRRFVGKGLSDIAPLYQVRGRSKMVVAISKACEEQYKGVVYCAEVPNGSLFIRTKRRNSYYPVWCGNSIRDPWPFINTNVVGTYRILEDARKQGVKYFIQVSTDEVYGAILDGAYSEDSRINPTNPYAASKAGADALVISYAHTFGMWTAVTRTENNYGPFQHPQKVFPTFVGKALRGEKLPVYGDGKHRRQWLWVDDHVDAILKLLSRAIEGEIHYGDKISSGQVFHVAGSQELENLELARKVLDVLVAKKSIPSYGDYDSWIEMIPDHNIRPGHDRRYALVCDKMQSLGWSPKVSLQEGIERAVAWYAENRWWLS